MDEAFVIAEFLRHYMADRRADAVKPLTAYQGPFPGFEDAIAAEYRALEAGESTDGDGESAAELPEGSLKTIGRYRILKELGHGGQGTVFLAEDPALGRNVALKVLSRLGAAADTTFARFEREALVASRLNHPGICKVYESGQDGGLAYIAMEFVAGETLAGRVARQREEAGISTPRRDPESSTQSHTSKQSVRAILEIGERAARALHVAHEAGVIHRDIKPGNIMIAEGDQPVILDFGLARATEGDFRTLTRTGDFFGTPAYMSPEQVSARSGELDRRTDVYSLAATLYECLTLRPPFGSADPDSLHHRILTDSAPRPSRLNRSVPRDLNVVLEKAMDREPRRRYATALDLAEELARVRQFEPIRARAPSVFVRLRRWTQRNPVAASFLLLLTVGLATALFLLYRVRIEQGRVRALGLVRESAFALGTDPTLALLLAREAVRAEERPETISQLQSAVARSFAVARVVHETKVVSAEFSHDGRHVVTVDSAGTVKLVSRDGDDWKPGPSLAHDRPLTQAIFLPQGNTILTPCENGTGIVWDVRGTRLSTFVVSSSGWRWRAYVAPNGERLLSIAGPPGRMLRICQLWIRRGSRWELERELSRGHSLVEATFSHDGGRVVIAQSHPVLDLLGWFPRAVVWSVRGDRCAVLKGHGRGITSVTFSPDDRRVLTTSRDKTARIWDAGSGKCLATVDHRAQVMSGCFFPGGDLVVTASFDGTSRISNLKGERVATCLIGGGVRRVAVSPSGRKILACGQGGRVHLFDRLGRQIAPLLGHKYTVISGRFSPAGDHVVTTSHDRSAIVWRVDWPDYPVLRGHHATVSAMGFIEGGRTLVTSSFDGTLRFWDRTGAEQQARRLEYRRPVTRFSVDEDTSRVAIAFWNSFLRLRDGAVEKSLTIRAIGVGGGGVRFLDQGSRLLVTAQLKKDESAVLIVDLDGTEVRRFMHDSQLRTADVSPDALRLVTVTGLGRLSIWDMKSGHRIATQEPAEARLRGAAFSPDGRRILTTASDGTLRILDAEGRELDSIPSPYCIDRGRFSPDGGLAVTASSDGAELWDLRAGRLLSALRAHRGGVTDVMFTAPNGEWGARRSVLTASVDGTVRVWPVSTADLLEAANRRAYRELTSDERERFAGLLRE